MSRKWDNADPRVIEYTCGDGVRRRFREFFWPDLLAVGRLYPQFRSDTPFLNFFRVGAAMEAGGAQDALPLGQPDGADNLLQAAVKMDELSEKGYAALLDMLAILFSEKYCDRPATRDQLETGDIVAVGDIKPLVEIAIGVAGLEKTEKKQKGAASTPETGLPATS